MKKLFAEFKAFISRGNVLDLAVGMIIGSAFTAIVTAVVSGILNPLIAMIPGADGYGALQVVLKKAFIDDAGVAHEAVILDFGAVITAIITFLLTALLLFTIVKIISTSQKKAKERREKLKKAHEDKLRAEGKLPPLEEKVEEEEAPKPTTEELLTQIRDLLMAQNMANAATAVAESVNGAEVTDNAETAVTEDVKEEAETTENAKEATEKSE